MSTAGGQWAVVFFQNSGDQTMCDAVGPFRSHDLALAATEKMGDVLHSGACPQLVQLHTLRDAVEQFSEAEVADHVLD